MNYILLILLFFTAGLIRADSKPYKGKAHQIPGKIEAEHYDEGDPGKAYHDFDKKTLGLTTEKRLRWISRNVLMLPMVTASAGRAKVSG